MDRKVAVIGAGQIGSRHLQGLANSSAKLTIYIVDPAPASIAMAYERFSAIPSSKNHVVHTVEKISDLPSSLDLVIVACTAEIRFDVYTKLLAHSDTGVILLEKVLFQDLDQYPRALELDAGSRSRSIVNLAKRSWPFFQQLKNDVPDKSQLSISFTGSNWGLGCNAVHHTDLVEYIWGKPSTTVARLDGELRKSKRENSHEFTGTIETFVSGGGNVIQTSYPDGQAPFVISARTPDFIWVWNVTHGILHRADADSGWAFVRSEMFAPTQSTLTTGLVDDVIAGKATDLPDLVTASATHLSTLTAILDNCRAHGHDFGRVCPVT